LKVFKERKEGVERETVGHNGANTMAEIDGEDKDHDVRKNVTGEASRRIDCMQRISLRQILIVGQNHPQSAKPTVVREQKQYWQNLVKEGWRGRPHCETFRRIIPMISMQGCPTPVQSVMK